MKPEFQEYVIGCSRGMFACEYEAIGDERDLKNKMCPKCGSPLKVIRMPGLDDYDRLKPSAPIKYPKYPKAEDGDEIILELE